MILVDTSVWADHFRRAELALSVLLAEGRIVIHPFVIGELALGDLRPWRETVATLCELPQAPVAASDDFLSMIADESLVTSGIGFVDAHLLLSARQTPGVRLWTRDRRLGTHAEAMRIRWSEPPA